jgi:hypothetical protein
MSCWRPEFSRLVIDGNPTGIVVWRCARFPERLAGYSLLQPGHGAVGVWIEPCAAIHTLWMRHPIDVAFVAGDGRVLRVDRAVPSWRIRLRRGARAVLELPAGRLDLWGIAPERRVALRVTASPPAAEGA